MVWPHGVSVYLGGSGQEGVRNYECVCMYAGGEVVGAPIGWFPIASFGYLSMLSGARKKSACEGYRCHCLFVEMIVNIQTALVP